MQITRRNFAAATIGSLSVVSLPLTRAFGAAHINSKINGVQVGAITYSFNRIASPDPDSIIRAYTEIGLGEAELMSNHCEALAGAPQLPAFARPNRAPGAPTGAGRPQLTPEQQAERQAAQDQLREWRRTVSASTWKTVANKFSDAGIDLALLCYNMQDTMKEEDIEYGFTMAEGLGVKSMTTSTTLTMAKRIAPLAEKHKITVGYHGHDATNDPNQTATLESYDILMSYGKYNAINLDIGHFTAAGYDAVAFIKQHHGKITNLHLKDRKKDHGPNVAVWGTGDTPMKPVLQLMKKEKYPFPANMELEYQIPPDSNIIAEGKKCFAYVKECLA